MPSFFFFNDTATTEIYTLSLHDALPICWRRPRHVLQSPRLRGASRERRYHQGARRPERGGAETLPVLTVGRDRKSTRLNSSHANISYAVFCLKKKIIHSTARFLPMACYC